MISILAFFSALFIGAPIFICLIAGTFIFLYQTDLLILTDSLPLQMFSSLEKSGLLAIPLFMIVGELMNKGGLTERLITLASFIVGRQRGGLAYVNLLTNAIASSILGSAIAQIAVMSRVMIPAMEKKGFSREFSAAVTVSGGLLGPIIPPSMIMIIYGVITLQPIAALFMAGILPGLLIIIAFAGVIFLVGCFSDFPPAEKTSFKKDFSLFSILSILAPLSIPLVIISGILFGIMTPTEAAAIGALLSFVIGKFLFKAIKISDLPDVLLSSGLNTALITGLITAASMLGWSLSFEGVPDRLVDLINLWTDSPIVFLLLVNLLIVVLGMFLESMSILIVMVPIIMPTVLALGIDLVHFGVVVSLATLIGLVTPPVGPGLFVVTATTDIKIGVLFKSMIPFLLAMFLCMALINIFPIISLYIPEILGAL